MIKMKRNRMMLSIVLGLLGAVFIFSGCQLARGMKSQKPQEVQEMLAAVSERFEQCDAVEIQNAAGEVIERMTDPKAIAAFIKGLRLDSWESVGAGKGTEIDRVLIFEQAFDEAGGNGELQEILQIQLYRDVPEVSVNLWRMRLHFKVPEHTVEIIEGWH